MSCANGQQESIAEVGSLGPIECAQKVMSFPRMLVSVMDIVQKFGTTAFDEEGVSVISMCRNGTVIRTLIGRSTPERLYSFDLKALKEHAAAVKAAGGLSKRGSGVGALMDTWRCARGACPVRRLGRLAG